MLERSRPGPPRLLPGWSFYLLFPLASLSLFVLLECPLPASLSHVFVLFLFLTPLCLWSFEFGFLWRLQSCLGMAHLLLLLHSRAWRVCVGLQAGAEEQLPVSSMLTVFHRSAASSSILMFLPGFPFCFETGWVSQSGCGIRIPLCPGPFLLKVVWSVG